MSQLLAIHDLQIEFNTQIGIVQAVNGISFAIDSGETVAIVGESGSGKSVSALAMLGLLPQPPARIISGQIQFDGQNILTLAPEALRKLRGHKIGMIFQEPMTSLNPVLSIGRQITETLRQHLGLSARAARARAIELLNQVGIADPERRLKQYPHHLSGGMRQRVMIAIAISCEPRLLIADEPTTALDVTIQAQILLLLKTLTQRLGAALILITHNLGIVARYADRVNVMYAGRIVEEGPAGEGQHAGLLHHGVDDARVAVALVDGAVGREEIEIAAAFRIPDVNALAPGQHHGQRMVVVGAVALFQLHGLCAGNRAEVQLAHRISLCMWVRLNVR